MVASHRQFVSDWPRRLAELVFAVAVVTLVLFQPRARAADIADPGTLRIGEGLPPTQLDPHFHDASANHQAVRHIFETLFAEGPDGIQPQLAESLRNIDELTWEVKLRPDVTFHDGTPFVAEDVLFSYNRAANLPNAPSSLGVYARKIDRIEIKDPETLIFHTREPNALFQYHAAQIYILSHVSAAKTTTSDMAAGRGVIGTGPYQFVSYTPGDRLELKANPNYWGKVDWDKITIRYIANDGARVAALLADELDLASNLPRQDIDTVRMSGQYNVVSAPSISTIYLALDMNRTRTPFVFSNEGAALVPNPMLDVRVREAISLAMPRQSIFDKLLSGQGEISGQFAATNVEDRNVELPPLSTDLERARALLAEAGYSDGFKLTVFGPIANFARDTEVLQAIAQGLTRIGIKASVESIPTSVFAARQQKFDFSMFVAGLNSPYGLVNLHTVAVTRDEKTGDGFLNHMRYSNSAVDALTKKALVTVDASERHSLVRAALANLASDYGIIPLYSPRNVWAVRKDKVTFKPSGYPRTIAIYATPVRPNR